MRKVILMVHNVRSALNVGSILRTAEGLGVEKVYLTGYTPYPVSESDSRMPHVRQKTSLQIHKTALGAEYYVKWEHHDNIANCINELVENGYLIAALEQTKNAVKLSDFSKKQDIALVVGNEVSGLDKNVLKKIKTHLQIPMDGQKESFNVAIAAAIALYHLKHFKR